MAHHLARSVDHSVSYESDSNVSDVLNSSTHANDYTLGKSFFEHHIIECIVWDRYPTTSSDGNLTVPGSLTEIFDETFADTEQATADTVIHQFAYKRCLDALKAVIDMPLGRTGSTDKSKLLTLIGAYLRIRGEDARDPAAKAVNDILNQTKSDMSMTPAASPERSDSPVSIATTLQEEYELNDDISRYSMIWKEFLDRKRLELRWPVKMISSQPPLFRAEIPYRNECFVGEGPQKRIAKHRAAQKACFALGLEA